MKKTLRYVLAGLGLAMQCCSGQFGNRKTKGRDYRLNLQHLSALRMNIISANGNEAEEFDKVDSLRSIRFVLDVAQSLSVRKERKIDIAQQGRGKQKGYVAARCSQD